MTFSIPFHENNKEEETNRRLEVGVNSALFYGRLILDSRPILDAGGVVMLDFFDLTYGVGQF